MTLLALITNDDGIGSEGLRQLAVAARGSGLDVMVVAPMHEASGTSASLASTQHDGRTVVEERSLPGLDGATCLAVAGAPGFIARNACRGDYGPVPDLVLSGINRGANTGRSVLHSGTVGAALTAHLEGCRAMAVSLAGHSPEHWATAARVAASLIPELVEADETMIVNLNVPDVALTDLAGLRHASLAPHGAVQATVTGDGRDPVEVGVEDSEPVLPPDSDVALLARGFATVTVLESVAERAGVRFGELMVSRAS